MSVFADIRAGEGFLVFVLALNVFILLAAYYVLKTVREALILTEHGAAVKTYAAAAQSALLIVAIPVFGGIASRVNRFKLIASVLVFFIVNLGAFYAGSLTGMDTSIVFFIWVGIFNVMAIAQFWGFANDLFSEDDGKRLFPVVGVGGSLGAWVGAVAAKPLIKLWGPFPLLLLSGGMLLACIVLTAIAHRQSILRPTSGTSSEKARMPVGGRGGFRLVFADRYLLLIALLMIVLNVVNTSGEFLLGRLVTEAAHAAVGAGEAARTVQEKWIGAFYADFFSWVNIISFALQAFVVYRIFRHFGVANALFVLPAIALGSYSLIAILPVLRIVRLFKIAENSTDYSIQNTTWQALFLPTSREAKYKAKQVIDSFCMRFGDVIQAGIVFAGTWLQWSITAFALLDVVLTIAWFAIVFAVVREYRVRRDRVTRETVGALT